MNASDIVVLAGEATSVARVSIFFSCQNEEDSKLVMEYLALLVTPSKKPAILLDKLVKIFEEQEIDPQKTTFCCLDGENQCRVEYQVKEEFIAYLFVACMPIAGAPGRLFVLNTSLISFLD